MEDKRLFSELVKNVPAVTKKLTFLFCGIGQSIDDLLGEHPSSGRYLEPVPLERLSHNFLWDIINNVAEQLNVEIDREILIRISIISDGFPHFVHLIGECLFWAMQDDDQIVRKCRKKHFEIALNEALEKSEPLLAMTYRKATEKTKSKTENEEALWGLPPTNRMRRQVSEIFSKSYLKVFEQRSHKSSADKNKKPLDKETFNQRLLILREESHSRIFLVGHGAGWFSFRENVFRGYVRLKAQTEGVTLCPDVNDV